MPLPAARHHPVALTPQEIQLQSRDVGWDPVVVLSDLRLVPMNGALGRQGRGRSVAAEYLWEKREVLAMISCVGLARFKATLNAVSSKWGFVIAFELDENSYVEELLRRKEHLRLKLFSGSKVSALLASL